MRGNTQIASVYSDAEGVVSRLFWAQLPYHATVSTHTPNCTVRHSTEQIHVLGAGPAGLAAAITLARVGRSVRVTEQRADVGGRFSGNLQMLTNYTDANDARTELLELVGSVEPTLIPQHEASLFGPSGRRCIARSREPFGYLLQRGPGVVMLDGALRRAAEETGVEFVFGVRGETESADIVATGGRRVQGVAREWHGTVELPDGFHVRFDHRVTPGGYGYLLVAEGRAVLGAAVVTNHKRIARAFRETVDWFSGVFPLPKIDSFSLVGSVDLFPIRTAVGADGELYVGEAGGFCDGLFGFGIRAALQSGRIAAEALLTGAKFDERWRAALGNRLETSIVNRWLYETGGNFGVRLFTRIAPKFDFRTVGRKLSARSHLRRRLLPLVKHTWSLDPESPHGDRTLWHRIAK